VGSWTDVANSVCPVARALAIVGERWTILILRELFLGSCRFEEIQAQTEISSQLLATRLKRLEADGLVERRPYSRRPLRYEYRLTEMGRDFFPVMFALRAWGERWCKSEDEELAVRFTHRKCGHDAGLGPTCAACGEPIYGRRELDAELGPRFAAERSKRRTAFNVRAHRVGEPGDHHAQRPAPARARTG
jgi:DNA-binding HxlR family transcriptional regulator